MNWILGFALFLIAAAYAYVYIDERRAFDRSVLRVLQDAQEKGVAPLEVKDIRRQIGRDRARHEWRHKTSMDVARSEESYEPGVTKIQDSLTRLKFQDKIEIYGSGRGLQRFTIKQPAAAPTVVALELIE